MIAYLLVACTAAVLYALLGNAVAHTPAYGVDLAGAALAGEAPRVALAFTASCWWEVLVAFGAIGIAVAVRSRACRARIVTSIVTTVVFWQVSNALKDAFGRPRPAYWRLIHETSPSYSSGHAMFATIVYGLWAFFVWKSDLPAPVRTMVPPVLLLWACGVIWSRLALGAHYVTDLAGGVLLGIVALSLASTVRAAVTRFTVSERSL